VKFIGLYDETLGFTPVLNKQHGERIVCLDYIKIPSDSSVFNKFSQVHGLLLLSYLGSEVLGSEVLGSEVLGSGFRGSGFHFD